jgi:protein-S-isoprenylcysteine O-methyltransferase Ste14
MTNGERIAADLRRAWNGAPWHGSSAAEVIGRHTARQAAARRSRSSHTPWQLVLHLVTWVDTPLRRIDDPAYAPPEGADFPEPSSTSDDQWRLDVARLGAVVEQLAQRVAMMPDQALAAPVGSHGYTYTTMMDGVAQHLAYHAGQVAMLALAKEESAGVIMPPPLIPLGALLIGELFARFVTGAMSVFPWPIAWSMWSGAVLIAAGAVLILWALARFEKAHTPPEPWRASRTLVRAGPYRFTRNPMYLGALLAQAGIGLLRNNPWDLLLLVPSWALFHWGVVLREERYLLKKFGEPYQQLLDTTRRWLV